MRQRAAHAGAQTEAAGEPVSRLACGSVVDVTKALPTDNAPGEYDGHVERACTLGLLSNGFSDDLAVACQLKAGDRLGQRERQMYSRLVVISTQPPIV